MDYDLSLEIIIVHPEIILIIVQTFDIGQLSTAGYTSESVKIVTAL
jgi:hypothetical protein